MCVHVFLFCCFRMAPPAKRFRHLETENTPLLKLKVITMITTQRVQRWTIGVEEARADLAHTNTVAAASDGQQIYEFVLFQELAAQIEEGKSYIVKNYSFSKFSKDSLLSTRSTKIYLTADVVVPRQLEEEATNLIRPPSTPVPLSLVTAPSEDLTVQGTITHVSF